MGAMANGGTLDGRSLITPAGIKAATAERLRGRDLVLPYEISWGAGFMRNEPNFYYGPTPDAFGHSGWGGSCAFADPSRGVSGAAKAFARITFAAEGLIRSCHHSNLAACARLVMV